VSIRTSRFPLLGGKRPAKTPTLMQYPGQWCPLRHYLKTISELFELVIQPNMVRAIGVDFDPS